ncbi:hypothetical protein M501DRAFT_579830 [Patellaria atrata CBS 101060]|uniref:Uncharacterized protein n=1 Tax=Patellaria atrata CBS 101060 TaxID=1346257 RepID=A0A9P4VS38_9PEZI|nr:hypothetical protein M501DRAFT_579830 [Patellaria atrata CBS 101060]
MNRYHFSSNTSFNLVYQARHFNNRVEFSKVTVNHPFQSASPFVQVLFTTSPNQTTPLRRSVIIQTHKPTEGLEPVTPGTENILIEIHTCNVDRDIDVSRLPIIVEDAIAE